MSEILQLRPGDWRTIPNLVTLLRLLLILPICGFIISDEQPVPWCWRPFLAPPTGSTASWRGT